MRMRFPRYLAAMFVGSLIWAGLWGVVIGGLVGTWFSLFLDSPWAALGVAALAAAVVAAMVLRSRRSRTADGASGDTAVEASGGAGGAADEALADTPGNDGAADTHRSGASRR
jgi:uncharacterized membrane protein YfcA